MLDNTGINSLQHVRDSHKGGVNKSEMPEIV